jgi:BON domain
MFAVNTCLQRGLAAVLGLCLARGGLLFAHDAEAPSAPHNALPTRSASSNQQMADTIAGNLRQSGHLRNFNVDISYHEHTAVLTGNVTDQMQHDEVLRIVQGVPGVDRVIDRLGSGGITPVQAEAPHTQGPALPVLPPPQEKPGGKDLDLKPVPPARDVLPPPAPIANEPTPIFSAPPPNQGEVNPPRLPPYAWPTYAPYNNYSRVAYPTSYPYNAWPYIGPFYPFPKVPPGWRSVKLEWDDGHWWFSKHATKYDWWRLRFW